MPSTQPEGKSSPRVTGESRYLSRVGLSQDDISQDDISQASSPIRSKQPPRLHEERVRGSGIVSNLSGRENVGWREIWILRRTDQLTIACLVVLALMGLTVHCLQLFVHRSELIEIDRAKPLTVEFRCDVNRADWGELTLLPGIGESLAKRIVNSRNLDGEFSHVEQLQRVRGIGPKKVESIAPYLYLNDP